MSDAAIFLMFLRPEALVIVATVAMYYYGYRLITDTKTDANGKVVPASAGAKGMGAVLIFIPTAIIAYFIYSLIDKKKDKKDSIETKPLLKK